MNSLTEQRIVVRRGCPEAGIKPYWEEYQLQMAPDERVLDGLLTIQRELDSGLAFRASCETGQCGADAMIINNNPQLACKTLIKDLGEPEKIILEPLHGYPVKKDLIVDLTAVEKTARTILQEGTVKNHEPPTEQQVDRMREAAICNLCGCCDSACPANWANNQFSGPASLIKLYRYLPLIEPLQRKVLEELNSPAAVWGCETEYNCLEVCPREINVTELISRVKEFLIKSRSVEEMERN